MTPRVGWHHTAPVSLLEQPFCWEGSGKVVWRSSLLRLWLVTVRLYQRDTGACRLEEPWRAFRRSTGSAVPVVSSSWGGRCFMLFQG